MYKNYKQFCHATSKTDCICFAFREHSILAVLFSAHPTADEILNEVIANSFFCFDFLFSEDTYYKMKTEKAHGFNRGMKGR
jgi:hypothetical protein